MTVRLKAAGKQAHIDNYYIFIAAAAAVKMLLAGLFSSDYQNELFMPFVSWFIEHGGNPYGHSAAGGGNAFPYPPAMLFIQSAGALLIKASGTASVFMRNLMFKLPSFLLDFAGLYFLARLLPSKRRYAAVFWYASPVVLYAVYMHGQLDLIPTVFLLGSVYYVSSKEKHRNVKGAFLMILALLSKLHVLAALPLVLMYVYKRDGLRSAAVFAAGCSAGTFAGMLPFWSRDFCSMVLFNEEQGVLTYAALKFGTVEIYTAVAAVLVLYLSAFSANIISRGLFLSLCGMVFAVFLVLCPPMPGWYVWTVPYTAFFFMDVDLEKYKNIAVHMLLNALYLAYFVFLHDRGRTDLYLLDTDLSMLKADSAVLRNAVFTLLTGTLAYIVFSMYRLGIAGNSLYRRRNIPFTIGIAGDSGTGKSTVAGLAGQALGERNILSIEGDADHKWERGDSRWQEFTHLNPKANRLYRQAQDLRQLRAGNAVRRAEYDHGAGRFTDAGRLTPKSYVVLCGLHALYLPQARRCLDLKIYMDTDEELRRWWKIQRDMKHRGYSRERILRQIEERMEDADRYIRPQKEYADMLVRYYDRTLKDCMEDGHAESISLRITVSSAVNVEPLVDELGAYGIAADYDYLDGPGKQSVDFDAAQLSGRVLPAGEIAERLIPSLEEITRERLDADNDMDAVIELFLLACISSRMRGEI